MTDRNKTIARDAEPDVDLGGVRTVPIAEIGAAAAKLEDVRPVSQHDPEPDAIDEVRDTHLPPLPSKPKPESLPPEQVSNNVEPHWIRKLSAVVLILMTSGFAGFLTGAAGGILLLTGALDIDSAWIKDVVNIFRGK